MNWSQLLVVAILGVIPFAGCRKQTPAAENAPRGAAPAASAASGASSNRHAAATVVPGSHEDWCGEHSVPESLCTRCNPSLVAAFQATHDWCAEHAVPESQCLLCNPGLKIERPPREAVAR